MGDIYGVTHTVTADNSNPKNRLSLTADATAGDTVHIRAIILSNDSTAAADGILIQRGTAVSGGSAATEFSLNGATARSTPTSDATTTTTTTSISITGGQTLHTLDLAASDREALRFSKGEFTLVNKRANDYDSVVIQQPAGTNILSITILWEED